MRDYVHISDVVSGVVAALLRGEPGEIYNISTGIGHNNLEVVETIRRVAGIATDALILRLLPARPFDVPANVLDAGKLRRQTGWGPGISFADGIAKAWSEIAAQHEPKG